MDITQFVDELRRDLNVAAQAGSDEVRAAAERLTMALDSSVRLTLMDALSQAASEITNELQGTSVELRLKGREPIFVVVGAATEAPPSAEDAVDASEDFEFEDEEVARITLRLPESLKARAEELAAKRGQSLNTWLVNATRSAASITINLGSTGIGASFGPGAPGRNRSSNKRIQGWVR
jgi:hypothetical protein